MTPDPGTGDPAAPTRFSARRVARGVAVGAVAMTIAFFALDQIVVRAFDPLADNPPDRVVIYTTDWCGFCAQLRSCLALGGVPFVEKDIEKSATASAEHWALRARGIPVTIVGKEVVYGLRTDRISALLAQAGHPVDCWAPPQAQAG